MWRRILKLNKLPCTILWCCDNNILKCCLHRQSKVTNAPYQTTSHCWWRAPKSRGWNPSEGLTKSSCGIGTW
jgi:hypothetical protein